MTLIAPVGSSRALALLRLSLRPGTAPALVAQAALDPEAYEAASPCDAESLAIAERRFERVVSAMASRGGAVLARGDIFYPLRLNSIDNAPPLLFLLGSTAACSVPSVAIVGTRGASRAGIVAAGHIARAAVDAGLAVVSGLALGIDGAAHETVLAERGVTVAVLCHGLDFVYPREHTGLARRIVESGGALVSERPPGAGVTPAALVRRDRLQSGLALATLLVEGGIKSGAMHTTRFARAQNRPVYAVISEGGELDDAGARALVSSSKAQGVRSLRQARSILGEFSPKRVNTSSQ